MGEASYTLLDWDSAFFQRRIARIDGSALALSELAQLVEQARRGGVECLYYLVAGESAAASSDAQHVGFRLIDVRATYERSPDPAPDAFSRVRAANASDLEALRRIASRGHRDSRFYSDVRFPRERCDELYAIWIERSLLEGYADMVLTVDDDGGGASGYITCSRTSDGAGSIGLFSVAERARGRGHGRLLLSAALHWFAEQGLSPVRVVTQGRNAAAQRIYQRAGFLTKSVQLWYHLWLDSPVAPLGVR